VQDLEINERVVSMKRESFYAGTVHGVFLLLFLLFLVGCAGSPPPRVPGTPDPGVLHRDSRQDMKLRVGKPEYLEEDTLEKYEKRGAGPLDNQSLGIKGIWKF